MKVKELLKTVNVAWSPPSQHPIMLAAGTAAQQLDASFNTSASLDLYLLNLQDAGYDMELKTSVPSDHRFHKVIWGSYGSNPAGIIVGGCDYGTIKIYSAAKILANETECLLSSPDRHTGPVRALDMNPFQSNLLASGATESEIYIWDIVNTSTPMTPGTRSQPAEDVQYIQWNKQVQHILASTFSQRCVIWDLRKNEPIIKLTDTNSKIRWKTVQWHPEVATQLCLASEDDQAPIIQVWDLRFATSPLKTLQRHTRGVLSIAWNTHDSDLLLSCAKDNTILCWNPNSDIPGGEVLCELAQTNQWNFDVSWCPRNPGLVVGSSFDGHAVVYSLLGGQKQASAETSNQIVDSFPGMDPFSQPAPKVQSAPAVSLKKAPKWLKKRFGASFGFGGKLTIFENEPADPNAGTPASGKVIVSQVITNPEMIQRSNDLETALSSEQFMDYCQGKVDMSSDEHSKKIWNYVGAYFSDDVTKTFLELLGYNISSINDKLKQFVPQEDVADITEGVGNLNNVQNGNAFDGSAAFDAIAQQEIIKSTIPPKPLNTNLKINTSDDEDGLITQAILVGNIEAAVSLCFSTKRYADAVILSMAGGPDLLAKAQYRYFSEHTGALNSLINSLVSENWSEIVKCCDIKCWKETLVGIFTHASAEESSALCDALGDRLASCEDSDLKKQAQICYICSGNLNKLIEVSETGIQDTVELVMIMKRALEGQSLKTVTIEGNIASILSQYAELLASEGDLESALNYVGYGQDPQIVMLRDRLFNALNRSESVVQQPTQQAAKSLSQNYYTQPVKQNVQPNAYQAPPMPAWNTNPVQTSYNSNQHQTQTPGISPAQNVQPLSQQIPQLKTFDNQPIQPPSMQSTVPSHTVPRPPSAGPRPKYMVDPSVKSGPAYAPAYPQQTSMYNPQVQQQVPGYDAQSSYRPSAQVPSYPSQSTMYNPMEQEPYKPVQPNIMTPTMPSLPQSGSLYDPSMNQPVQNRTYNNKPAYQPAPHTAGWNDPPSSMFSRQKQQVNEFQVQNPIMQPIRSAIPQQESYQPEETFHQNPRVLTPQNHPNHPQMQNRFENMHQPPQAAQPAQPVQPARIPEPEKPKAPIPEQYLYLKTCLDELKSQCYESAKNPQTKRKIEDVSRKLEVLYNCLRENSLSPNTVQGLHQISQMIQAGNYTNGLSIHSQMVAGPDFSQIASFMPGIKVLLQSALQLGVYIT